MKFVAGKEEIFDELQLFQGIIEKRSTMPILANILIEAKEDHQIKLTGTDLEVGLRTSFAAEVIEAGDITISGKKIFEIVKSLPDKQKITFALEDEHIMEITSGVSEFKVLCLPKEDYPNVPEPEFKKKILLPLDKFQDMIDRVYFAITQEQRYHLSGALMILKESSIELVSTDGHRLAYVIMPTEGIKEDGEIRGIISRKTLNELKRLEGETIQFDLDENNLFFRVGKRTLISRVIEGKFPNYEAVIPQGNPNIMIFEREKVADAVRRVSLLSTERSRGITFNIEKDKLSLFSSNPELGEARDETAVDYDGEAMEIGFNSQYLLDFLASAVSKKVRFEINDKDSAVLIKPEEKEQIDYKYVLMPMKL